MVSSWIGKTGGDFKGVERYNLSGFAQPTEDFDVHEANLAENSVYCMEAQLTTQRLNTSTQADQQHAKPPLHALNSYAHSPS
ncbi:hypothetical protein PSE10B_56820 [Pseudomonas amygdali pv. eriobotryae]|nr:hypothetical protein PSE10B_56820 [Pseudomonas amygdali pv. eriobotryae]